MNQYPILVELQETEHGQMYVFFTEESIHRYHQPYTAWMCRMDPVREPKKWSLFDTEKQLLCRSSITTCLGVGVSYTLQESMKKEKNPNPPNNILKFK